MKKHTLAILLALLCGAFFMGTPAHAQKTKAELSAEVSTTFPDNTSGLITPTGVRAFQNDLINSIMPTAPVVSGNLACFNGTTGLLQDCGTAPDTITPLLNPLAVTSSTGGFGLTGNPNLALTNSQLGLVTAWGVLIDLTASSATAPEGAGSFNITSSTGSANPDTAFKAALSGTALCNSGSANCWAQTNVIRLGSGGSKRGGVGLEIDLDQLWSGNYSGVPTNPYAANLAITGQNTGGYASCAICIEFAANASPMWNYGIHLGTSGFQVYNTAAISDNSNSPIAYEVRGSHTDGINMAFGSFSGAAISAPGFSVTGSNGAISSGGSGFSNGRLSLFGTTSGAVSLTVPAVAGTPTVTFGTSSGTPAVTASAPLAINTTTGNITCASCLTNTPAALTKTDDTNVTLTLGGTPATALLQAASMTLGWTGQLAVGRGGTGLATLTANTLYKGNGASALAVSSVTDDGTTFAINTNKFTVTEANGNTVAAGSLTAALLASSNEVRASGNLGGSAGAVSMTGTASTTISTGTGTVKMSSVNNANNAGWLLFLNGTSTAWVPYWSTNSP